MVPGISPTRVHMTQLPGRLIRVCGPRRGSSVCAIASSAEGPAGVQPPPPLAVYVTNEVQTCSVLPAQALYDRVAGVGVYKGRSPWWKIVVAGVLAGVYTAMGGILLLTVGPNCTAIAANNPGLARFITGAIGLPIGLITLMTCGGDLFTGNTAVVTVAALEGKVTTAQLVKSWVLSYFSNMAGCAIGIGIAAGGGLLPTLARGATAIAAYKTSNALAVTLVRAIGANWLVCLAVWQCIGAQTYVGKFLACFLPLSTFITIGLEHSVANMFLVPLGILAGADVSIKTFILRNLIPVTIGNIIAGAICVAVPYSLMFGRLGKKLTGAE